MQKIRALALAAGLALTGSASAQVLQNGSFEFGGLLFAFDSWESYGNVSQSFDFASDGFASAKLFGGFPGDSVFFQTVSGINPGDEVRISIKALTPPGDSIFGTANFVRLALVFADPTRDGTANVYEAGVNFLDGSSSESFVFDTTGEITLIAPLGVSAVQFVGVFVQPAGQGGAAWLDEANLEVLSTGNEITLVNGDFEEGGTFGHPVNGWREFGNAIGNIFVLSGVDGAISGNGSLSIFGQFNGTDNDSGVFQSIPAAEGETWNLTADVRSPIGDGIQGANIAVASLSFGDAGGNVIGESIATFDSSTVQGVINPVNLSLTAPAGTATVTATFVYVQPGGDPQAAGRVDIDNVTLTIGGSGPVCLGDIADDFGLTADEGGGPDGVVDFGDFAALLGLIGPCDGGVPGCLGDIADDFGLTADEGGGPDGVVDFGDFAALLGLIGPCN